MVAHVELIFYQDQIRSINEESAEDVNAWFNNARSIQDDIARSKRLANDIVKRSENPDVSGKSVEEAEEKAAFIVRELDYNYQIQQVLRGLRTVNTTLDEVEEASSQRRILDALHLLERSWTELDSISASKSCRAMKLLDIRAFELKSDVHEVFERVWKALVHVDLEQKTLTVTQSRDGEPMSLPDAVIGLKAYKEVDQRMALLWHDLDTAIIGPRTNLAGPRLPTIYVNDTILKAAGETDRSIKSLYADLEKILTFLSAKLPEDLIQALSEVMIPQIVSRITGVWLSSAVPSTLKDMEEFEDVLSATRRFCETSARLNFKGFGELEDWIDSAPKVWLSKCRETALDAVRARLARGLGPSTEVERVETQMVSLSEGKKLTTNGTSAAAANNQDNQDWDAAWSDEEDQGVETKTSTQPTDLNNPEEVEDDGADAWGAWGDENEAVDDKPEEESKAQEPLSESQAQEDDDAGDAWGWGDEETTEEPQQTAKAQPDVSRHPPNETREMTLRETYHISSLPDQVLTLVYAILEDGAALTSARYAHVLFNYLRTCAN